MKPLSQLTDAEINAEMAEFCGWLEIEPDPYMIAYNPTSHRKEAIRDYLHDANALAEVKAKLREEGYDYFISWSAVDEHDGTQTHLHEAEVVKDIRTGSQIYSAYDDKENRAFCLAVIQMVSGG